MLALGFSGLSLTGDIGSGGARHLSERVADGDRKWDTLVQEKGVPSFAGKRVKDERVASSFRSSRHNLTSNITSRAGREDEERAYDCCWKRPWCARVSSMNSCNCGVRRSRH